MKLLVVGCGSIGRRHARNAQALGADVVLCDLDDSLLRKTCSEMGGVPGYRDHLEAVEMAAIHAAVVAVPTSQHVTIATQLAQRGIHLLVEKPLSHSLEGVEALLRLVKQKQITAMMGQSYRFHEGYLTLRRLLDERVIGKLYHVHSYSGWYLPDWHIHEDYRREYAARRSLGGGVALTTLSHSFDTFRWLFGEVEAIVGWKTRLGSLSIDVEDSTFCLLRTTENVIIFCGADFLSRLPRNDMVLTGSEGHIEADFSNSLLRVWRTKNKRFPPDDPRVAEVPGRIKILEDGVQYEPEAERVKYDFEGNHRYLAEMAYFLDRIRAREVEFDLDLRSGVRVLELLSDRCFQDVYDGVPVVA